MRIAQVTPVYPPYRGGTGQVAFEYTERLRALGHDVHVFTPRYQGTSDDPPYVHRLSGWPRVGNAAFVPGARRAVAGFDLVHLHYPFFGGAEPLLGPGGAVPPVVLSYHMDATAPGVRGAIFAAHERLLLGRMVSRAARVIVSSRDYAEHSALVGLPGVVDRAEVIPYGVDLERFHPGEEPELRRALGIGTSEPVVIFVGGLDRAHAFKGVPVLIDALHRLRDQSWRALIVGDGSERAAYARFAGDTGLGDRVVFTGGVSAADLPSYYRMSDVHVLPSTSRAEAFGLVTLEAAASGVPSVVTELPGVRTTVVEGETGRVVPPGDAGRLAAAIRSVCELPRDRRALWGRAARARAVERDWEAVVDSLTKTYARVVSGSGGRA